eukprot:1846985-Prymnesium_polylepis.1
MRPPEPTRSAAPPGVGATAQRQWGTALVAVYDDGLDFLQRGLTPQVKASIGERREDMDDL